MKHWKLRFFVIAITGGIFIIGPKAIPQQPPGYYLQDWFAIRKNENFVGKKITIFGFLDFRGNDGMDIHLWETRDSLTDQRPFYSMKVDLSARTMITDHFNWDGGWRMFQALPIEITGSFERQKEGFEYLEPGLGTLTDIQQIAVKSNGYDLMILKPKPR